MISEACVEGSARDALLVVLGGSCFMGRALVQRIAAGSTSGGDNGTAVPTALMLDARVVAVCNRGTVYWGGPAIEKRMGEESATEPYVRHFFMDRDEPGTVERCCAALAVQFRAVGCARVAVVDFSCDEDDQMEHFLDSLAAVGLMSVLDTFIYISSDSVYDGADISSEGSSDCSISGNECSVGSSSSSSSSSSSGDGDGDGAHAEGARAARREASVLPIDESAQCIDPARVRRGYGRDKRAIELVLQRRVPCAVWLRLPDVIGPFDDTGRFWATLLWAGAHRAVPMRIPAASREQLVSVVYSKDVVDAVLALCSRRPSGGAAPISGGPLNLACEPPVTLEALCAMIAESAGCDVALTLVTEGELHGGSSADTADYYPSVECGPISAARARAQLRWQPTPVATAVRTTSAFFSGRLRLLCAWGAWKTDRELARALRKLPPTVQAAVHRELSAAAVAGGGAALVAVPSSIPAPPAA